MHEAPRTPVLVGAAAVQQREEDPFKAREPLELMIAATEAAARDAGSRALLGRADVIATPRGFWSYPDPGRRVAERIGARRARTELAEIGVLQTTLLGRAAQAIADDRADVVIVTGGETKYRLLRATKTGCEAPVTDQGDVAPDEVLRPDGLLLDPIEGAAGLLEPVTQYAMLENALRAAEGLSLAAHRTQVAELWAAMSRVAADNPDAWSRAPVSAETIREAAGRNRMLAFPYTKLHTSQWNVDQAASLILCSAETARSLDIPRERWIFPWVVADSNHMLPLLQRPQPARSPGFACAAERIRARTGCELGAVPHLELYSCFPAAVRMQQRELGIPTERPVTVTGGMAFAGGPLNNFVLQAQVRMVQVLRDDPGSTGLVSAVSGYLTKQGLGLWSSEPGPQPFHFDDVTEATARATPARPVAPDARGHARVVTYTVTYADEVPQRTLLLCDLEDGRRTLATSHDPSLADALTREEGCGRPVRIGDAGVELP